MRAVRHAGVRAVVALGTLTALIAVEHRARAAPFGEGDLDALLASRAAPVDTVDDLVPLLPDELRENFTFVYESRSPFAADITPDRPRVILFSEDGTFVLTFVTAGHAKDVVETLSFDRATATFATRARALPAAVRGGVRADELAATCPRCHGADPRPILDSYPAWPGFYGSMQDTFPPDLPSARRERARYERFLARAARRRPYRDLRWVLGSPLSPYTDPRGYSVAAVREPEDGLVYQPNTRLGMALTELNRRRLFRKLAAAPGFATVEPTLVAGLLGCDAAASPGDLDAEAAIGAAVRMEDAARLTRLGIDARAPVADRYRMAERGELANLARIDRLASAAGVSRSDWSLALEPYSLSFYDGILAADEHGARYALVEDWLFELVGDLAKKRPALAPYFRPSPSFPALGYPFGNKLDLRGIEAICPLLATEHGAIRAAR